jgi:hypothetical protein
MEVICMKKSQMEFYFGNEINLDLKNKKSQLKQNELTAYQFLMQWPEFFNILVRLA